MAGAGRLGEVSWRYVFIGLCLVGLAVFRLEQGSVVWAVVFGLAALANAYLSVLPLLPSRFGGQAQVSGPGSGGPASEPPPEELRRALKVYESRVRGWLAIAAVGWVVTVGTVLLVPPLGLVGAALSLFATYLYLRCRRSVRILHRALSVPKRKPTKSRRTA